MKIKNIFLCLSLTAMFAGCAGSGVHTSLMSPEELMSVDEYTLCNAYTPRERYSPSLNVVKEVRRRGLDCRTIYTYVPVPEEKKPTSRTTCYYNGPALQCTTY